MVKIKWLANGFVIEPLKKIGHGDVLNKYLYLSDVLINAAKFEMITQHLIADGFDKGTDRDLNKKFFINTFFPKN